MKIGLFGGTFDPIHNGHIHLCENLIRLKNLDKIIFIPSAIPPHKLNKEITSFGHRYNMVKLAIADNAQFDVSDLEERRLPLHSYTYDTLCAMMDAYSNDEVFFVIGADSLVQLHTWFKCKDLVKKFSFITYIRNGFEPKREELAKEWGDEVSKSLMETLVCFEPYDISSSTIREKIAHGDESYLDFISSKVGEYIKENKLYLPKYL